MRIVTWNLGFWQFRKHHEEAWTYLRETIRPDLALLQEVYPPAVVSNETLAFREVHNGWGTAVLSRGLDLREAPLESDYPSRVAVASVSLESGSELMVASIHAPIIEGRVFSHLARIMDEVEKCTSQSNSIVGGDLNSARLAESVWPGYGHGPFFERMDVGRFVDCCQKVNGREIQTFFKKGLVHPFQDDHIFVTSDLVRGLKECRALDNPLTRRVSDHIPLMIELEL